MTDTTNHPHNPLLTRPSRTTGSMTEWDAWVKTLSRRDRDKLYPGMHISLIPAYEVIMGKEETYEQAMKEKEAARIAPPKQSPAPANPVSPFGPASEDVFAPARQQFASPIGTGASPGLARAPGTHQAGGHFGSPQQYGKKKHRGILDAVVDGADWLGDQAVDAARWAGDKVDSAIEWTDEAAEAAWESAKAAWGYADEFVELFMEAPEAEQRAFLAAVADTLLQLHPAYGGIRELQRLINNPKYRTTSNIALAIAGLVPLFKMARIGPAIMRVINTAKGKWRRRGTRSPASKQARDNMRATASGGNTKIQRLGRSPEFQSKYGEILKGVIAGFVVEAIEQSLSDDPNYFVPFVQGASGGATGAISDLSDEEGSQLARRWALESLNSIISRVSKMALTGEKITLESIVFGVGEGRTVALLTDWASAGYRVGIERASRRLKWDRTLTNLLKQSGPPVVEYAVRLFAHRVFGVGEEPSAVEAMQDVLDP